MDEAAQQQGSLTGAIRFALVCGVPLGALLGAIDLWAIHAEVGTLSLMAHFLDLSRAGLVTLMLAQAMAWVSALLLLEQLALLLWQRVARSWGKYRKSLLKFLVALLWTLPWHHSVMDGDGVRAREDFWLLYIGLLVLWTVTVWVWLTYAREVARGTILTRALFAMTYGAVSVGVWIFSATTLPLYTRFHAMSVVFGVWTAGWVLHAALRPLWHRLIAPRRALQRGLVGAVMLCGAAVASHALWSATMSSRDALEVVEASQLSRAVLKHAPIALFDHTLPAPNEVERASLREAFIEERAARRVTGEELARRGEAPAQHVIVIVLESMRASAWSDPDLTPRFHQWRAHGTYFPHAIAAYPATPLAYGAMFLSQSPYTVVRSSRWAEQTPIDVLLERGALNEVYLSQPDDAWFEHNPISRFVLSARHPRQPHHDVRQALEGLRQAMHTEVSGRKDARFFGWVHVYEAHQPYELRAERRAPKAGEHHAISAYYSEVSEVDAALGEFMDWFWQQPFAEQTLVVVVGDHGEALGDMVEARPFWGHHVQVHGSVSQMPLFLAGPGVARGRVIKGALADQLDLIPTLYDALGEALPERFMAQGESLFALIAARREPPVSRWDEARCHVTQAFNISARALFARADAANAGALPVEEVVRAVPTQGYSPKDGIVCGRYKLVYARATGRVALYRLDLDPEEQHDLSQREPEVTARLEAALARWVFMQQEVLEATR